MWLEIASFDGFMRLWVGRLGSAVGTRGAAVSALLRESLPYEPRPILWGAQVRAHKLHGSTGKACVSVPLRLCRCVQSLAVAHRVGPTPPQAPEAPQKLVGRAC